MMSRFQVLDGVALANLEVLRNSFDGGSKGSLWNHMNRCKVIIICSEWLGWAVLLRITLTLREKKYFFVPFIHFELLLHLPVPVLFDGNTEWAECGDE